MSLKTLILSLSLLAPVFASPANAGEITASTYVHHCCPGYYSATYADLKFHYTSTDLPWGTTVLIKYGFKSRYGSDAHIVSEWKDQISVQALASAPFTWDASVKDKFIYGRGGEQESHVQFVVQIVLPDGSVIYDKGSNSTWGFWEGYLFPGSAPDAAGFAPLYLDRIVRW